MYQDLGLHVLFERNLFDIIYFCGCGKWRKQIYVLFPEYAAGFLRDEQDREKVNFVFLSLQMSLFVFSSIIPDFK